MIFSSVLLCFYTSQGIVIMTNVSTLTKHVLEITLVRKFHLGSQFQRCQCVTLGSIDSGIGPRWDRSSVTWEKSIAACSSPSYIQKPEYDMGTEVKIQPLWFTLREQLLPRRAAKYVTRISQNGTINWGQMFYIWVCGGNFMFRTQLKPSQNKLSCDYFELHMNVSQRQSTLKVFGNLY